MLWDSLSSKPKGDTMGYTTDFEGRFSIRPSMKPEHIAYINRFAHTRRMKRDAELSVQRPDPIRIAAGLPIGNQGGYFVGADGDYGQEGMFGSSTNPSDVMDHNGPPHGQPGLWCKWEILQSGGGHQYLVWNGMEKFYGYVEWLNYLIAHFFEPWGYHLDGTMLYQGEEPRDRGCIGVIDNKVSSSEGDFSLPEVNIQWDAWNDGELSDDGI